ncbi:MAG: sigma-70 family RNA polymerase sigma factor [Planctomycetota bacterium]
MTRTHSTGDSATLKALAAQALVGEAGAFEELHRRLGGGLKNFIGRRLNTSDEGLLEGLAQEVWVVAWQALEDRRYDPERAAFTTFLYAVGHKIALRHLRDLERQRRLHENLLAQQPPAAVTSDLDDAMDLAALLEQLETVLQRAELTPEERALAMAVAQGETERTVAANLDLPASTVHVRKKRLLNKLRTLMRENRESDENAHEQSRAPRE